MSALLRIIPVAVPDVVIRGKALAEAEANLLRSAMNRYIFEIGGPISKVMADGGDINGQLQLAINRRMAFKVLEHLDCVTGEIEQVQVAAMKFSINDWQLNDAAISVVHQALVWYRDHWEQKQINIAILNSLIGPLESYQ